MVGLKVSEVRIHVVNINLHSSKAMEGIGLKPNVDKNRPKTLNSFQQLNVVFFVVFFLYTALYITNSEYYAKG